MDMHGHLFPMFLKSALVSPQQPDEVYMHTASSNALPNVSEDLQIGALRKDYCTFLMLALGLMLVQGCTLHWDCGLRTAGAAVTMFQQNV